MSKNFTAGEINEHYLKRHGLRTGLYGDKPYANYGYWIKDDATIDQACDAMTQLMIDQLDLRPTDRLLEVGCGYGASAHYVATHCCPASYVGLDATEVRIDHARQTLEDAGYQDRFRVQLGDATVLPFDDSSFDKLMAIECAFHFSTREDFLREAYRVLAPGSILAMSDIILASEIRVEDYRAEELRDFLGADLKCISDANIYQAKDYLALLQTIGFVSSEIISIRRETIPRFSAYLEAAAHASPQPYRDRRMQVVEHFRKKFMVGADYVKVRAVKPQEAPGRS